MHPLDYRRADDDDGAPREFVAQYMNEPPETCGYQYAYGRVCRGGRMEHKWWENRLSHPEPHEPTIYDHAFTRERCS